jgi:signal transduction histidine kinase
LTPSKRYVESGIKCLRQIRVVNSEGFRFAALFAVVFLGLAGTLCAAVLWIVDDTQTSALISANDADIETIENGFKDEGIDEAIEVVKQRLGPMKAAHGPPPGAYILVQEPASGKSAGNITGFVPQLGLFELRDGRISGRGVDIARGIYLFVGRDTDEIRITRVRIVKAFGWIIAGSILLAGAGGMFLRVQLMRRVDSITRTCEGIIAGRFSERIPLRRSGDELERLSVAINEMLNRISALLDNLRQVSSDVAHDLRTPLTRLRNRLDEARRDAVTSADYAAAVARAIDDTDQVLAIFSALLRISQIEAGTRAATFESLSLTELLEGIVEMYQPVAEDNRQRLLSSIQPEVRIRGDAELLTQMFSNLVENAIRHTPMNTSIRVTLKTSEDNSIVAGVIDNGPGIPVAEHEKVLRRFYRLSGGRSTAGHGLGLALVAAIANLHQATLSLKDAEPGLCISAKFY